MGLKSNTRPVFEDEDLIAFTDSDDNTDDDVEDTDGGAGANMELGGNISVRLENGRLVTESSTNPRPPTGTSPAAGGGPGGATGPGEPGGRGGRGPLGEGSSPGSPAGIRHP